MATKKAKEFAAGDFVVYPAHGVGIIEGIDEHKIGDDKVRLYSITFAKDKLRLKIPIDKSAQSGLRALSSKTRLSQAMKTMRGKPKVKRVMWSRRAQEYEGKINSGDVMSIAEVLRDLQRNVANEEYSYSERVIFRNAMERLASELAVVEKIGEDDALKKLEKVLKEANKNTAAVS